jgi:hypothetical protein
MCTKKQPLPTLGHEDCARELRMEKRFGDTSKTQRWQCGLPKESRRPTPIPGCDQCRNLLTLELHVLRKTFGVDSDSAWIGNKPTSKGSWTSKRSTSFYLSRLAASLHLMSYLTSCASEILEDTQDYRCSCTTHQYLLPQSSAGRVRSTWEGSE